MTPKPQPRSNARSIISLRVIEMNRNETKRTAPHRRSEAKQIETNTKQMQKQKQKQKNRNRSTVCNDVSHTQYVPYQEVVGGALARPKGLGNLTPQMSTDRSTSSIWVYRPVRRQTDRQFFFNVCVCMCARVHLRACACARVCCARVCCVLFCWFRFSS